jgi:hypothetical protein
MTGFFSWFRLGFSAIQFSETDTNLPSTITCGPRILGMPDSRVNKNFCCLASSDPALRRFRPTGTTLLSRPLQKGTLFARFFYSSCGMFLMTCFGLCRARKRMILIM